MLAASVFERERSILVEVISDICENKIKYDNHNACL